MLQLHILFTPLHIVRKPKDLNIPEFDSLFDSSGKYSKAFQLFMYALMYSYENKESLQTGIVSLRKLSSGVMETSLKGAPKSDKSIIFDRDILQEFEEKLVLKICEIFDTEVDFYDYEVISSDSVSV